MATLWLVFIVVVLNGLSASAFIFKTGQCYSITDTKKNFDISKFTGTWYVIQSSNTAARCHSIQIKEKKGSYAFIVDKQLFSLLAAGIVHNLHYEAQIFPNPKNPASMVLRMPSSLFSDISYEVIDTDYNTWAVMWACKNQMFGHLESGLVLSRTNTLPLESLAQIRENLLSLGVNKLSTVQQKDCNPKLGGGFFTLELASGLTKVSVDWETLIENSQVPSAIETGCFVQEEGYFYFREVCPSANTGNDGGGTDSGGDYYYYYYDDPEEGALDESEDEEDYYYVDDLDGSGDGSGDYYYDYDEDYYDDEYYDDEYYDEEYYDEYYDELQMVTVEKDYDDLGDPSSKSDYNNEENKGSSQISLNTLTTELEDIDLRVERNVLSTGLVSPEEVVSDEESSAAGRETREPDYFGSDEGVLLRMKRGSSSMEAEQSPTDALKKDSKSEEGNAKDVDNKTVKSNSVKKSNQEINGDQSKSNNKRRKTKRKKKNKSKEEARKKRKKNPLVARLIMMSGRLQKFLMSHNIEVRKIPKNLRLRDLFSYFKNEEERRRMRRHVKRAMRMWRSKVKRTAKKKGKKNMKIFKNKSTWRKAKKKNKKRRNKNKRRGNKKRNRREKDKEMKKKYENRDKGMTKNKGKDSKDEAKNIWSEVFDLPKEVKKQGEPQRKDGKYEVKSNVKKSERIKDEEEKKLRKRQRKKKKKREKMRRMRKQMRKKMRQKLKRKMKRYGKGKNRKKNKKNRKNKKNKKRKKKKSEKRKNKQKAKERENRDIGNVNKTK